MHFLLTKNKKCQFDSQMQTFNIKHYTTLANLAADLQTVKGAATTKTADSIKLSCTLNNI